MIFTEAEIQYITTQRLGRLATVRADSTPQVNPVSCYYNPNTDTIDIGGNNLASSQKYRNVRINPATAVVIDDMPNTDPKSIRCLEVRGRAEALDHPTDSTARLHGPIIRIHPRRIISWGIDTSQRGRGTRTVQPRTARPADGPAERPGGAAR